MLSFLLTGSANPGSEAQPWCHPARDLVDLEALENVIFIGSSLLLILDICPFQCFQICSTKSGRFSGFNCKFQVSNLPSTNCSITSTHFVKFVSLIEYFNEFLANQ